MAKPIIDVDLSNFQKEEIYADLHSDFLKAAAASEDPTWDFARMSGIYWGVTAMDLLGNLSLLCADDITQYVLDCHQDDGGFSPAIGHDSHVLSTLSAVQILSIFDKIDKIAAERVCEYVIKLQNNDGSFNGDKWGEVDTRFSFAAVSILSLVKRLDLVDADLVASYVMKCYNVDGGFGTRPWSESHAGQVFCCLGTLSIIQRLRGVNEDLTGWWLAERQLESGGLNGRPQKKPDVCYSWWVLSSLVMLGKLSWIDGTKLKRFILYSQDEETGGIADRPGNMSDPYHTLFGLAGLSLLQESSSNILESISKEGINKKIEIKKINPVFCMPQYVIDRLAIHVQLLK